jgi:hypothetical protein
MSEKQVYILRLRQDNFYVGASEDETTVTEANLLEYMDPAMG